MDHIDKLIPIAVLLAVAGFLLVLLRMARSEKVVARQEMIPAPVVEPVAVVVAEVLPKEEPTIIAAPVVATKKKRKPMPVLAPSQTATPIQDVLGLLKKKDALVAAFLLREILGPPRSRLWVRPAPRER